MRVLRNLPDQGLAIGIGHPVLRFDLAVGGHHGVEACLLGRRGRIHGLDIAWEIEGLGVHDGRSL